jgi:hypothetical protein
MDIVHTPIERVPLRHRIVFERVTRLVEDDVRLG